MHIDKWTRWGCNEGRQYVGPGEVKVVGRLAGRYLWETEYTALLPYNTVTPVQLFIYETATKVEILW